MLHDDWCDDYCYDGWCVFVFHVGIHTSSVFVVVVVVVAAAAAADGARKTVIGAVARITDYQHRIHL